MSKAFFYKQKIRNLLAHGGRYKLSMIADTLNISRPTANKYLKELYTTGVIFKQGSGPHTHYYLQLHPQNTTPSLVKFSYEETELLEHHFLKYDSDGTLLQGVKGFEAWCKKRKLDPQVKVQDFSRMFQQIQQYPRQCGLLDASSFFSKKMKEKSDFSALFYGDQYSWQEFGRGAFAEQFFYAKLAQDKKQLKKLMSPFVHKLLCVIDNYSIDAIALTPPSIKNRRVQVLDVLNTLLLDLPLPRIALIKYFPRIVPIPQKSLKTSQERIRNAQETIFLEAETLQHKTVLLIDDFVGSGATLHETAKKLKNAGVKSVIGFAFVGNLDLNYEVINEM